MGSKWTRPRWIPYFVLCKIFTCPYWPHWLDIRIFFFLLFQSMIGHCLGAAGGLEAIASIKAIQTSWLHPTINQFVRFNFVCFIFLSFYDFVTWHVIYLLWYCRTQSLQLSLTQLQILSNNMKSTLVSFLWFMHFFVMICGVSYYELTDSNLLLLLCAAISNSFGFGGHNSVVAFSAFKPWIYENNKPMCVAS